MTRIIRYTAFLIIVLIALIAACSRLDDQDAVQTWAGDPYMGSVDVSIIAPGDSSRGIREHGRGSAQFIDKGNGRASLIVTGHIQKPADAGFTIDGISDDAGWSSRADDVLLSIGKNGRISGGGVEPPHRLRFDGVVSKSRFDLTVYFELLEKSENGLPPGTKFIFSYELERSSGDDSLVKRNEDCKRIVWQARNIADFSGAMHMIQVPVCVRR